MTEKFRVTMIRLAYGCGLAALLAACATQPAAQPHVPGFAAGLMHGFGAIIALVGSVYFHIRIYAFPNGGFWYDAGFVMGFSLNILIITIVILPWVGGFITRNH